MNKDVLIAAQKTIAELNPAAFDMAHFSGDVEHSCGTSHCIAGWIVVSHGWEVVEDGPSDAQKFRNTKTGEEVWTDWDDLAAQIAGLDNVQRDMLFYMQYDNPTRSVLLSRSSEATPEKAIQAIQNLMDHDDCRWDKILGP